MTDTMFENPFLILGIPQEIIDLEITTGNSDRLQKLIEGAYKNLSKIYHPDRGGDDELFARLTSARDEILSDPMSAALFFSSREGREVWNRRLILQRENALKGKEKSALFKLFTNINPKKVLPWMKSREALVGNIVFGGVGKSLLLVLSLTETDTRLRFAVSNYDGRRFFFSKVTNTWKVSTTNPFTNRPSAVEVVRPFKAARYSVIGGISEAFTHDLISSREEDLTFSDMQTERFAIEASDNPDQLSWTPVSKATWLDKVQPVAERNDYLVLMSSGIDVIEPSLTIIGPVFATRRIK